MKSLKAKLIEYTESDIYPMHMPGHKRNTDLFDDVKIIENIDFTEVEGLDNLHDAKGIIKESMDRVSEYLGTDQTYFLVNGSTSGVLAAIQSVTDIGDQIIIGRNSHKSVYNAVEIRNLNPIYLYPESTGLFDGGYKKEELDRLLEETKAKVVVITSPTYEGVVADVKGLAEVTHKYEAILIVDSAHGAHFGLDGFPNPAYKEGADIVIESVHKTLPALTQTALLHVMGDRVDKEKLERALATYQTSSPSYVFMASIDECFNIVEKEGNKRAEELLKTLDILRRNVNNTGKIFIPGREIVGKNEIFDYDIGKLVIDLSKTNLTGVELAKILRNKYKFETEMANNKYVIAMTSIADDLEKVEEFGEALVEIAEELETIEVKESTDRIRNEVIMSPYEALNRGIEVIALKDAKGRIAGDYIYKYPPGIPLIVPGEVVSEDLIKIVEKSLESGLQIKGITDKITSGIKVIKE
ncbi:MAG: aminotransferase class I/II-fold pyridoxal phosphate-dependent enzyme [Eubacterium sp.]|nr:aminotransferase class I/II-fold pyridoxal phosphate-dependent enzyme [Eubacterium sp.]